MTSPDYIIVGGGTSGLVVANRLSEDPKVQVLVLEAGDDLTADPRVNIPAFWTALLGSDADWQYHSTPQPGLKDRSVKIPLGKAIGDDIDAWEKLGNAGWDWASLVPYYRKSYTLLPPKDQATLNHLVSFPGVLENPLCKAWIDAFRDLKKITTGDPFSGNSIGGYSHLGTIDPETKTRSYAGSAYALPALGRPNFEIITGAKAHKILFQEIADGVVATGVQAEVNGEIKTFTAAKEVIIASGTFNTPKLLELSGIGGKDILEKHGIPVTVDLPAVGENLQDHVMTGVSYEVVDGVITGDALMRQEPEALALAQELYEKHRAGPFTVGGTQSHAFMPSPDSTKELLDKYPPTPENQDYYNAVRSILEKPDATSAACFLFQVQANLHEGGKSIVGSSLMPENFVSLGCFQSHPLSRGATHISSADVNAVPDIDPRYFSHPADLEILARHVQALEDLRQTKALGAFIKPDGKRNHPDSFHIGTLEGAKKYVLDTASTTFHACGTAAMLPKEKGGVVDTNLVVYGTKNLRVVDASIFPLIPRGNIMSSVYAVAEKAADVIKGI
ncbi:hypothetical protein CEP52_006970 [Fusarium oligoseptatum]|uniref:Glucose-methanol-choline oxidoreductase N-terminal domain-containing protein n=1 Tax=Fusarium oligoseptatum TaxID=2604345 RepID=A0A428TQ16_9HYPO|nr:hypothetical protein CEP52_006970 [Fusarium oligoseptatum]